MNFCQIWKWSYRKSCSISPISANPDISHFLNNINMKFNENCKIIPNYTFIFCNVCQLPIQIYKYFPNLTKHLSLPLISFNVVGYHVFVFCYELFFVLFVVDEIWNSMDLNSLKFENIDWVQFLLLLHNLHLLDYFLNQPAQQWFYFITYFLKNIICCYNDFWNNNLFNF